MLKKMAMAAVAALLTAVALSAQPDKNPNNKEAPASQKHPTVILAAPNRQDDGETNAAKPTNDSRRSHTPFKDPNWVLVIVGSVTCLVIGWQSFATAQSVKAAFLQIQMTKSKERARIQLEPKPLEILNPLLDIRFIGGALAVVNLGMSRAFIVRSYWRFFITPEQELINDGDDFFDLLVPHNFIDPTIDPIVCEIVLEDDPRDLDEFAEIIAQGERVIHLYGFIEYETAGSLWHKDFGWIWKPMSGTIAGQTGISAAQPMTDFGDSQTLEQKIANGVWIRDSRRDKPEYEIKSKKQYRKAN
jgi:hypothetical protein